jgi:hypothetical protein
MKVIWRGNRLEILYTQKTAESIRPEEALLIPTSLTVWTISRVSPARDLI